MLIFDHKYSRLGIKLHQENPFWEFIDIKVGTKMIKVARGWCIALMVKALIIIEYTPWILGILLSIVIVPLLLTGLLIGHILSVLKKYYIFLFRTHLLIKIYQAINMLMHQIAMGYLTEELLHLQ